MFSCGKRREPRGEDLYTSVHAMAIRSTVVDMEPTKHVPLQRPQQQQRKHSVFDGEILKSELKSIGVKPLHVLTIWTYVLRHVDTEAHDVPGLPHAAVEMVKEKFSTLTSHVLTQQTSADGSTTKLLIRLQVRLWQFRYNPSASYQE
jgi:hypothetical protein